MKANLAAFVPMLSSVAMCVMLAGCSAGTTSTFESESTSTDAGTTGDTDAGDGWQGHENVAATLNTYCSGCHGTTWASSCWSAQASASSIQSEVSSGAMPRGATMAAADQTILLTWITDGATCSGTKPANVDTVGGGGGETPTAPATP